MFPGQLKPSFARHDQTKRYLIAGVAVVLVVGCFASLRTGVLRDGYSLFPILIGALVAVVVFVQVFYHRRIAVVRKAAARVAEKFPGDRVVVANARFSALGDGVASAGPFATAIVQISDDRLYLWNPDSPEQPYSAAPLAGLDVKVEKGTPPRWSLSSPYSNTQTRLAIFTDTGLIYERFDRMNELAAQLFPALRAAPRSA